MVLSHLFKTARFLVDNHKLQNRKSLIINNYFFHCDINSVQT